MIFKNATTEDLENALIVVNQRFNNNVIWNRFDINGKNLNITLRVVSSKGRGHSIGYGYLLSGHKPKRLISACWHVHGYFFEALLKIAPDAVIISRGRRIDQYGGNWEDWDAGSMMYPQYMSEKCECQGE